MGIDTLGLRMDVTGTEKFLGRGEVDSLAPAVAKAVGQLEKGTSVGADFLGWMDLPVTMTSEKLAPLESAAARARKDCEVFVVIGIGGSYLGARAVLDAMGIGPGQWSASAASGPEVLFSGTDLCSAGLSRLLGRVEGRELRLCVVSKSGTTLEPAIAFRVLRRVLQDRYGRQEAAGRITAITDAAKGALRCLAEAEGYETFVIPDDVGGRFSVLTPVGLLPVAVAGVDIGELVAGAAAMREVCQREDLRTNPAHLYAATRYALYCAGFRTEILSSFHSGLGTYQEWWKQLMGESEGKDGKGIFPAAAGFTTDLHSLGQYIQDGRRALMETFLCVEQAEPERVVPRESASGGPVPSGRAGDSAPASADGLDYLEGRSLDEINWKAYEGTRKAHIGGGVPCISLELERLTPKTLGGLIYLMEKAVAVSGLLLKVNPFDQPGVEAYKKEMFNLLGKA